MPESPHPASNQEAMLLPESGRRRRQAVRFRFTATLIPPREPFLPRRKPRVAAANYFSHRDKTVSFTSTTFFFLTDEGEN